MKHRLNTDKTAIVFICVSSVFHLWLVFFALLVPYRRGVAHPPQTPPWSAIGSEAVDAFAQLFAERRRGKEGTVFTDLRDVFGIRPTTFEAFAQRYAPIFRGELPPPRV